jgi:hypothetical protein
MLAVVLPVLPLPVATECPHHDGDIAEDLASMDGAGFGTMMAMPMGLAISGEERYPIAASAQSATADRPCKATSLASWGHDGC